MLCVQITLLTRSVLNRLGTSRGSCTHRVRRLLGTPCQYMCPGGFWNPARCFRKALAITQREKRERARDREKERERESERERERNREREGESAAWHVTPCTHTWLHGRHPWTTRPSSAPRRNTKPYTPHPKTRNSKPETRNPKTETENSKPKSKTLHPIPHI